MTEIVKAQCVFVGIEGKENRGKMDLTNHKVNPKCNCTKCFIKDCMDKSGESYEEIIKNLLKAQEDGIIEIDDYDKNGFPLRIKRIATKKQLQKLLKDDGNG
jgi:hypothetical protein